MNKINVHLKAVQCDYGPVYSCVSDQVLRVHVRVDHSYGSFTAYMIIEQCVAHLIISNNIVGLLLLQSSLWTSPTSRLESLVNPSFMLPYVYHSIHVHVCTCKPLVLCVCIPTPSTFMHVLGACHFFIN